MNRRTKWARFALVVLLFDGCQGATGVAPPPTVRHSPKEPATQPITEGAGAAPELERAATRGNMFAPFINNEFNSWTLSHRVDMPIVPKPEQSSLDRRTATEQPTAPTP